MSWTHEVSTAGLVVTKTYRSWSRDEHLREWAALRAISAATTDLVPEPLQLRPPQLSRPPSITMRLVPGQPLTGKLTAVQLVGLEASLRELWSVQPGDLPPIPLPRLVAQLRDAISQWQGSGIVYEAHIAARDWLAGSAADELAVPTMPVIGQGDGNLSNYLWDGARVRIVDFEDAGLSDVAVELANLVEHIAGRENGWEEFVGRFAVDPLRLHAARTLWAIFWLTLLRPGGPAAWRNPPGTAEVQGARVLSLLERW